VRVPWLKDREINRQRVGEAERQRDEDKDRHLEQKTDREV